MTITAQTTTQTDLDAIICRLFDEATAGLDWTREEAGTRQDLIRALTQVQNHPAHRHHDILSITGCGMDDDEVRTHLDACIRQIASWNFEQAQQQPKRRRRAAGRG